MEDNSNGKQVNNMNGISQSQHINNLAMLSTEADFENTYSTELRNSEIVSHSDAILDM